MNALFKLADLPFSRVMIISIVISGLYFLVGYDNGASLINNREGILQQIEQTKDEIKKVDREIDEINTLKRAQERDAEKLNFLLGYIPEKLTKIELMKTLSNEAKTVGANIQSINDIGRAAGKETEFYEEIGIQLELSGSFSQMVLFLSNLTKLTQIVSLDALSLRRSGGENDPLSMSAMVKGYRYVEKATGAKPK